MAVCERLCGVEDRIIEGGGEVEMRYRAGVARVVETWLPEGEGWGRKVVAGLKVPFAVVRYRGSGGISSGAGKVEEQGGGEVEEEGGDSPWRKYQGRIRRIMEE